VRHSVGRVGSSVCECSWLPSSRTCWRPIWRMASVMLWLREPAVAVVGSRASVRCGYCRAFVGHAAAGALSRVRVDAHDPASVVGSQAARRRGGDRPCAAGLGARRRAPHDRRPARAPAGNPPRYARSHRDAAATPPIPLTRNPCASPWHCEPDLECHAHRSGGDAQNPSTSPITPLRATACTRQLPTASSAAKRRG
jgi:hypothetical protein